MSSILLNMEWRILRLTHEGPGYTTSTFDVKPSLRNRISNPAGFIILVQSIVVAFLSFWIYQEYLNNRYLQAYVNDYLQTSGWAIAIFGVIAAVGAVTLRLFLRNKTVEKEIGAVSLEARVPGPVATGAAEVSPKPDTGFHPVVAALKAELAGRPVPYGTASVSSGEESKTEGVDRPSTSLNAIVASPKAELAGASAPVGAAPVPRMEEGTGPAGVQPPVVAGPTTPRDLSTVITGVVQVPKKREAEARAGEKPPSQ